MKYATWRSKSTLVVVEQALWSLSNLVIVTAVGVYATLEEASELLALLLIFGLQAGLVRSGVFESRGAGAGMVPIVGLVRLYLLVPAIGAYVYASAISDSQLGILAAVGCLCIAFEEVYRFRALDAARFEILFAASAVWLIASLFAGAAVFIDHSNAYPAVIVWLCGAVVAGWISKIGVRVVAASLDQPPPSRFAILMSPIEYFSASGLEQIALIAGATTMVTAEFAASRLALAWLGPVNLLFLAWRALVISGGAPESRNLGIRGPSRFALYGGAGLVSVFGFFALDIITVVPRAMELAVVFFAPRLVVGGLSITTLHGRHGRGFVRAATVRALPGLALLGAALLSPVPHVMAVVWFVGAVGAEFLNRVLVDA